MARPAVGGHPVLGEQNGQPETRSGSRSLSEKPNRKELGGGAAGGGAIASPRPRESWRSRNPSEATSTNLHSTQPIGLTDEELADWSKSKGFRVESAGEQLGMFGANEPVMRVFRSGPRGKEQKALVYQSQLDQLKQAKPEPTQPFALTGANPASTSPHFSARATWEKSSAIPKRRTQSNFRSGRRKKKAPVFSPANAEKRNPANWRAPSPKPLAPSATTSAK